MTAIIPAEPGRATRSNASTPICPARSTVGLENKWGDGGVQYFYGAADYPDYGPIENHLAIVFEPAKTVYLPLVMKNH